MKHKPLKNARSYAKSGVIVRYSEIALKRGNRGMFENRLMSNIRRQLKYVGAEFTRVYKIYGRVIVETDYPSSADTISKIFGVSSASPTIKVNPDIETLKNTALITFNKVKLKPQSFRITVNRLEKSLSHTSQQLESLIGQHIVDHTKCRVSLENPVLDIGFEVKKDAAYLYTHTIKGVGGLPAGVSGRVIVLLSGGIDSPVAAWLCLRRGCDVTLLHFLHEDHTKNAPNKLRRILKKLRGYHSSINLVCVPASEIERELVMNVPTEYRILVLRRIFFKIAEMMCKEKGYIAVASGDNIGQVASQTLVNMAAINSGSSCLWIRPLECFNKQEIVDLAREIGTYDLSIEAYTDCCNFLLPKHPVTGADIDTLNDLESRISNKVLDNAFSNSFSVTENGLM